MNRLRPTFGDPDLDRVVELLRLGEEHAQLAPDFCQRQRSGPAEGALRPLRAERAPAAVTSSEDAWSGIQEEFSTSR